VSDGGELVGIVLAAGGGSRFGGRKQLAPLGGRPMLEHVLETMSRARLDRVLVVLGSDEAEIRERLELHGAEPVSSPDWRQGQARSLSAGIEAAGGAAAVLVALGDQPGLSHRAIDAVLAARGGELDAVRAVYGGVPGHPVLIERRLFGRLIGATGDVGARAVISAARHLDLDCDGLGDPADVDTREALRKLEAGPGSPGGRSSG
jgi:CTP:molybdopterin cytidylyltransferase MocA